MCGSYLITNHRSYNSMIESSGKPYVITIRVINNLWNKRDYLLSICRSICDLMILNHMLKEYSK